MELVRCTETAMEDWSVKEFIQILTHNLKNPYGALKSTLGVSKIYIDDDSIYFNIHTDLLEISAVHRVKMRINRGDDLFELYLYDKYLNLLDIHTGLFLEEVKKVFEDNTGLITNIPHNITIVHI